MHWFWLQHCLPLFWGADYPFKNQQAEPRPLPEAWESGNLRVKAQGEAAAVPRSTSTVSSGQTRPHTHTHGTQARKTRKSPLRACVRPMFLTILQSYASLTQPARL